MYLPGISLTTYINLLNPHNNRVSSVLKRKLKQRRVNDLPKVIKLSSWRTQDSDPSSTAPGSALTLHCLHNIPSSNLPEMSILAITSIFYDNNITIDIFIHLKHYYLSLLRQQNSYHSKSSIYFQLADSCRNI